MSVGWRVVSGFPAAQFCKENFVLKQLNMPSTLSSSAVVGLLVEFDRYRLQGNLTTSIDSSLTDQVP
eukprot:3121275-Amphidinium_carterae.1